MQQDANEKFPRELSAKEKNWLFCALPKDKLGYKQYRDIIDGLMVIGFGRFGGGNLILGEADDIVDLSASETPIFAVATITFDIGKVYVVIHEDFEGQIEVDINSTAADKIPDDLTQARVWTYSNWKPGEKAPLDNTAVREIHIVKNKIVLAIAPVHKKVWVYNAESGINHFIPVTNFYNELMILMNIKDSNMVLNPGRLFSHLKDFTDDQLAQGFLVYNKRWQRIEMDLFEGKTEEKKKSFFDFLKK